MKQTITIELDLQEGQQPYEFLEKSKKNTTARYHALQHFFEDIGYNVTSYGSKVEKV